jgi:hypothetical protein
MGEGVDPTQMCQSLVDKVAQSRQLQSITDPDLLILFEDWLEELEAETRLLVKEHSIDNENDLAASLGLSPRGAKFLLTKIAKGPL